MLEQVSELQNWDVFKGLTMKEGIPEIPWNVVRSLEGVGMCSSVGECLPNPQETRTNKKQKANFKSLGGNVVIRIQEVFRMAQPISCPGRPRPHSGVPEQKIRSATLSQSQKTVGHGVPSRNLLTLLRLREDTPQS